MMTISDLERAQKTFTVVALVAAAITLSLCGCGGMPTEGIPCEPQRVPVDGSPSTQNDCSSSSSSDGSTGAQEGGTGSGSAPTTATTPDPEWSSSSASSDDSSAGPGETSETSAGGSSSDDDGSSSGEAPIYDGNHCDDECADEDRVVDDAWPACVCAPLCETDDDCEGAAMCGSSGVLGEQRCYIECEGAAIGCPTGTDPTLVCGAFNGATSVCMWINEGP